MYVILDLDKNFDYPELIGVVDSESQINNVIQGYFGWFEFTSLRTREEQLEFERYGEIMYGNVIYADDQTCKIVVLRDI